MNVLFSSPRLAGAFCLRISTITWLALFSVSVAHRSVASDLPLPRHKLQVNQTAAANQSLKEVGRLIADYGAYSLYDVPQELMVFAGQPGVEARDEYNQIQLNTGNLNTSKAEIQALRNSVGIFPGKRLHLVQFAGPVQPAWHAALGAAGLAVVTYIPQNAYLVYGDAKAIGRLQSLAAQSAHIQWEGAYLDDYKLHPEARSVDSWGQPRQLSNDEVAIQLVADPAANEETLKLLESLRLEPFRDHRAWLNYDNVVVRIAPANLAAVAARPDVISIMPYDQPQPFCERQAQIVAGNLTGSVPTGPGYLSWLATKGFTQAQFTNSNFAVDLTDSGIDNGTQSPNHPGLHLGGLAANASRVIYNRLEGTAHAGSTLKGCDGHGTLNSHVICGYDDLSGFPFADAAGFHYGLGICPFTTVGSSVIFDPSYTAPNFPNLQSRAYRDGARVSNNSWGGGNNGRYTINSQSYDALVRDAQPAGAAVETDGNQEMVIVFAAGNAGPGASTVGNPGTAKNVFTIGAAENVQPFGGPILGYDACGVPDTGANSANDLINFSSRGPCTDGRVKPDLCAPGTHVSGGVAQAPNPGPNGTADSCFMGAEICGPITNTITFDSDNFFPAGQQFFTTSSGTSHAAPCVAGGCALLRQYFINHGLTPPSAAMTKAYLMNSGRYMTGTGANDSLYSNNQGMGEMNLGFAFDGTPRVVRDELAADLFTASGQTRTFSIGVTDTNKPLRITLAWTDAPGNTTGSAFNNDLDLTLVANGVTYKGNVFSGPYSISGGVADSVNNVESIFLPAGSGSGFTVTITASSINSDGVPNNGTPLDQDFALVVYNAFVAEPPTITSLAPTNLMVLVGQPFSFGVAITGTPPMSVQWQLNGSAIPGATALTYGLAAADLTNAGDYSAVVSNAYGMASTAVSHLTVLVPLPLAYALNNSNLTWSTDIGTPWFGQASLAHDGVAAAQSWPILAHQQSSFSTSVNGPGSISFWWKVASADGTDTLNFLIGGVPQAAISGQTDWSQKIFFLPPGPGNLSWIYTKGGSSTPGLDAAYVDEVFGVIPFITAGDDSFGQTSPVGGSVAGATAIAAGAWHSLALKPDGTVSGWGYNFDGECNPPEGLADAIGIAAGGYHSLALRANQHVVAWGANSYGESSVPVTISNAVGIAAGTWHSLALLANGRVVGWGDNSAGQLSLPAGLSNVVAIAAGGNHNLALLANGKVIAWGENTDSQGAFIGQSVVPANLSNVIAIAAGDYHSLAVRADGTVVGWGDNSDGQAQPPAGLTGVSVVAAGGAHSLALRNDGTVAAWGRNWDGQCSLPPGLAYAVAIAAGEAHSLVLLGDSTGPLPLLINPVRQGSQFSVQVQTIAGKNYSLEYKNAVTDANWTGLPPSRGNGALQFLVDPTATPAARIYRVRVW
jgi:hypothetical protein